MRTILQSIVIFMFLASAAQSSGQTQIIATVAGGGTSWGNGAPAAEANLSSMYGVTVDGAGNLYISCAGYALGEVYAATGIIYSLQSTVNPTFGIAMDGAGNIYFSDGSVYVYELSGGKITKVAGNGTQGYSGNGGKATAAELNSPGALAVDSAGNLYIADTLNNAIRKVSAATGIISTVAGVGGEQNSGYWGDGGPATAAGLYFPDGVAVDSAGNIYIADQWNRRIRMVTAATGIITTVAGNGTEGYTGDSGPATAAELGVVYGVALDSSRNIFIATDSSVIREVTAATGIITTIAGNGVYGYSGDGGPPTAAELSFPDPSWEGSGIVVDGAGNIYFTDASGRVREVTQGLSITIGFTGDGGGSVSLSSGGTCSGYCNLMAPSSVNVFLTPTAATGSTFVSWSGCDSVTGNQCMVKMDTARSVAAQFNLQTFADTYATTSGNGTITSSSSTVDYGGSVTFTMTPSAGYTLWKLTDNGADVTSLAVWNARQGVYTYTITDVTSNHTVDATFGYGPPPPPPATPVPALSTPVATLLMLGLAGILWRARRKRQKA